MAAWLMVRHLPIFGGAGGQPKYAEPFGKTLNGLVFAGTARSRTDRSALVASGILTCASECKVYANNHGSRIDSDHAAADNGQEI